MNNVSYHVTNQAINVSIGDVFVFNYSHPYQLPTRSVILFRINIYLVEGNICSIKNHFFS